jgi:uncharacterized phage protein (TIGR02218 family)
MGALGLGGVEEFFLANSTRRARLLKITPTAGLPSIYLTTTPTIITFENDVYLPTNAVDLSAQSEKVGSKSYDTEIMGVIDSDLLTESDLNNGVYRGAEVVEYIVDPKFPLAGALRTYRYFINDISWNGENFSADVVGVQANTAEDQGASFSRNCTVQLFSEHCGLNKADFQYPSTQAATVSEVTGDRQFDAAGFVIGTGVDPDFFIFGVLDWVSGDNIGRSSTVFAYEGTTDSFALAEKPVFPLTVGDQFYVTPGCQKTSEHCRFKFDNIINYQGNPFVRTATGAIDAPSSS